MRGWAEFVLKHRRLVVTFWLLVMVGGAAAAGVVSDRMTINFDLPGQPGTETGDKIEALLGNGGKVNYPYLTTITLPAGQTVAANAKDIGDAFQSLDKAEIPVVGQPRHVRVVAEYNTGDTGAFRAKASTASAGRETAYAMVFAPYNPSPTQTLLNKILDSTITKSLAQQNHGNWEVGITGEDPLAVGEEDAGGPGVLAETLLGGVGALAVLAFVFGSFLALLPLVVAAASILFTFVLLLPITEITDVSFIVQFLVALVGLGVAIDYSLLLVTRWREERDHGRDNHEAVVVAMQTAGHAVIFSGVTVAIGLLALVVLPVPFMRSMGYGGALIPLASVLTTLTLTPAILGGIGPKIDWPKIRHENNASRAWSRWATLMVRRRVAAALIAFIVLGVMIAALFTIKIGQASTTSLASSGKAYDAWHRLDEGGVPSGAITPILVLAKTDQAAQVATGLKDVSEIKYSLVPKAGTGSNAKLPDGTDATALMLIPDNETVNSRSIEVVRRIIDKTDGDDRVIGVTGLGSAQIDFLEAVYGNFPLMLGLIALLTYVLLVRAFRSLLLPLKAVLLNLVSLAATLGVMVWFWQDGHGSGALFDISATGAVTFWIPMMVFAFLFGLSMDYEVFILSRIREEYDGAKSTDAAVIEGIGRTGRLVTCAALILFLAFAALASGPGTDLKTLATGLGFGILLDATIVRSLLVPSLVSLFGRWNWYLPAWAAKPLRVEPSYPHTEPPRSKALEPEPVG